MAVAVAMAQFPGPSRGGMGGMMGYEDQIVPTLRKRLEQESAYISHRLSSYSSKSLAEADYNVNPPVAHAPPPHTSREQQQTGSPSQIPVRVHSPRVRQKSTPFSSATSPAFDEESPSLPRPIAQRNASSSGPSTPPATSSAPPSRIPTRPRSKSQLAPRPSLPVSHPALPNARPPISRNATGTSPGSHSPSSREGGRESPELELNVREGFIKNELPPFKLQAGEAMRIAERGHDLRDEDQDDDRTWEVDDFDDFNGAQRREIEGIGLGIDTDPSGSSQAEGSTRKRASSMRSSGGGPDGKFGPRLGPNSQKALGLGNPRQKTSTPRSATGAKTKLANGQPSPLASSSSTARSASLNMLASSQTATGSRLGVAAHFIPPQSTYTPPKGQDWDTVVLPAVAKKLGLKGDAEEFVVEGDEGDLAVEWDKDGRAVRWLKRVAGDRQRPGRESSADGSYIDDYYTSEIIDNDHPLNTSHASAFSPTFEPSPDNPLRAATSIERLRPKRSGDMRTPLRVSDSVHTPSYEPPVSPAPFSSMDPDPTPRPAPSPIKASHSISRKPSVLRKNPTPPVSRQPSMGNMRQAGPGSGMRGNEYEYFSQGRVGSLNGMGGSGQGLGLPGQGSALGYPPPTPGTTHHLQEMIYQNSQRDRTRRDAAQSQSQSPDSPQSREKRRAGCGCVVM